VFFFHVYVFFPVFVLLIVYQNHWLSFARVFKVFYVSGLGIVKRIVFWKRRFGEMPSSGNRVYKVFRLISVNHVQAKYLRLFFYFLIRFRRCLCFEPSCVLSARCVIGLWGFHCLDPLRLVFSFLLCVGILVFLFNCFGGCSFSAMTHSSCVIGTNWNKILQV